MAEELQQKVISEPMTNPSLIKTISIDLETFTKNTKLNECGVYKYSEDETLEVLLFGYSINGGEVEVIDVAGGEEVPSAIIDCLRNPNVIKYAFNAQFERIVLSRWLKLPKGEYLPPEEWRCTMIWSAYNGLPLSLKGVGAVLKLDEQKMDEGKSLINYFCAPCSPTKSNGGRTRNMPYHAPDKWRTFKDYNRRDVEVEVAIQKRLQSYPVPDFVWEEYFIDQRINDRGVGIDLELVKRAIEIDGSTRDELSSKMKELTELDNPNSVAQVKMWLSKLGFETDDLGKKNVAKMKKEIDDEMVVDVLTLRQQLSKSSVKKYQAMKNAMCLDKSCHGMFQFYGTKTGRWAGRLVQMQNLPQNHLSDLKEARELVKQGNVEALKMLYEDIPDTLSQLIRTAFVPRDGMTFYVADFSAIEARVIAFLANEEWRLETFRNGGDIYCASASQMFKVPVEKHGINGHLRQKGKIAELALGYGGSSSALQAMGALEMGLTEDELAPLVSAWRSANPCIVKMWWDVDKCIKNAIKNKTTTETHGIKFSYMGGMLFIILPSGRKISYVKPRIETNRFGTESVTYEGVGTNKAWERIESYGPKFVENIVQAIARDILCNAMRNLKDYRVVMHIHDELVIEAPKDTSLEYICEEMARTPSWMKGIPLRADGYITEFYMKD